MSTKGQKHTLIHSQFPENEVLAFKDQLQQMQATMVDEKFVGIDGTIPEGQEVVKNLLYRCLRWADIVLEKLAHHYAL